MEDRPMKPEEPNALANGETELVPVAPAPLADLSRPRPFRDPTHDLFDFARNPRWFAVAAILLGAAGILLAQVDFVQRLLFIAPVFEELLKFGVALGLFVMLRITWIPVRVMLALIPGGAFGVLEHLTTYSSEAPELYALRVAFHAGATAASMATWCAIERDRDWRLRWMSTIPSTLIHGLNNGIALVVAIILALTQAPDVEALALLLHVGLVFAVFAVTLAFLFAPHLANATARTLLRIVT